MHQRRPGAWQIDPKTGQGIRLAVDLSDPEDLRDATLPWWTQRPIPPRKRDIRHSITHGHFPIVQVGAVPGQEQLELLGGMSVLLMMPTIPGRNAMQSRQILVATIVRDRHHLLVRTTECSNLRIVEIVNSEPDSQGGGHLRRASSTLGRASCAGSCESGRSFDTYLAAARIRPAYMSRLPRRRQD